MSTGVALGIGCGYTAAYFFDPAQVPGLIGGALLGVMVSPDWDVDNGNISYYMVRKMFGVWGEVFWGLFIGPYAVAIKHREFISHFPLISTLFRLTYILFPCIIFATPSGEKSLSRILVAQLISTTFISLCYILATAFNATPGVLIYHGIPVVIGLTLSDVAHTIFDYL